MIETLGSLVLERGGYWMGNPDGRRSTLAQPAEWFVEALTSGYSTLSGETVTPTGSMQFAAVQGSVRLLSEVEASLPCHLYRERADGGKDKAKDSYLYAILHDSPNPEMTAFTFWQYMRQNRALWGNGYALPKFSGTGRWTAIYPLRPDYMTVGRNPNGTKIHEYDIGDAGSSMGGVKLSGRYLTSDLIHVRGMGDDLVGWSPIKLVRNGLGLGLAAERATGSFYQHGAKMSGILEIAGKVRDLGDVADKFNEKYAGASKTGKVLVIDQGSKFVSTTIPPDDAQFLLTIKASAQQIYLIYGIPPHLMGDTEKSTSWGTGIEQQTLGWQKFSVGPSLEMTEQEFELKLLGENSEYCIEFAMDGLLRADAKTRADVFAVKRQNGIINADEWRAYDNENPIGGEVGSAYLVNGTMIPVDIALAKKANDQGVVA